MSTLLYAPKREWVGRPMRCPRCTAIVAYDETDLKPTFKPVVVGGRFEVNTQCRHCRAIVYFRELSDEEYLQCMDGAAPFAGEDRPPGQPEAKKRGDADGDGCSSQPPSPTTGAGASVIERSLAEERSLPVVPARGS